MSYWDRLGFLGNLGTHLACSNVRIVIAPIFILLSCPSKETSNIRIHHLLWFFSSSCHLQPSIREWPDGFIWHRWGETRTFPLAVWPPYRRCAGLETRPRKAESKSAPLIARCRYKAAVGLHGNTKTIANKLQTNCKTWKIMMIEIPKNAAVGQSDLFASRCFSSATPGHWLTFLSAARVGCFLQLHPNQLMSERIWSHRFWHMTSSNEELPPGWLQYSARSHEERSASSFSQSSRKEEDLRCFVEEGSRYAQGASDWKPASWGGWMDSFMMRCDLIRTWKVVSLLVEFVDVYENQEPDTHTEFLISHWSMNTEEPFKSIHMGHDSSETALPQEQQVGQVLRLLEILIWKDSELQALLRREGRAFSDLVASLQQEGSSGSDLLQASKRWSCMLSLLQFWHPVSRTSLRIQQDSRFSTSYNDYQLRHSIKWTVYMFYSITF